MEAQEKVRLALVLYADMLLSNLRKEKNNKTLSRTSR